MSKDGLAPPPSARTWTKIDTYLAGMAHRRTASRRTHKLELRTQPETPRLLLSTLPFLALLGMLGMLAMSIAIVAWPSARAEPQSKPPVQTEVGVAPKGWFQQAEKEFAQPQPVKPR